MTEHNVMICLTVNWLFSTINYLFSHYTAWSWKQVL